MAKPKLDAATIRQRFLDYFARHGHRPVRSSSLVPQGDPTLYFVNAGMVQFKDVFVGRETRDYRRACSSQKCLRVSGKHNDLENVGRTARHHTFFEMLGNFSFGDYFKREAIPFAWEFLTGELGLEPGRMVATVFGGSPEDGLPPDDEAFAIWRDAIGLGEDRILRLGKKDNFWAMGDSGPCGPCSEIHYFQGDHIPCPEPECAGPSCECDRWLEIWNNVFMQFERAAGGALEPLRATGVDTGMGLERLTAVVQGVDSNYDTDLLRPHIALVERLAGKRYGASPAADVSMRVIADHARATAFCIADGVFPEKGGREYVLRRIMRRAIRHGKLLGLEEPFLHEVCASVALQMGAAYPELRERAQVVSTIVQAEEASFRRTLDRGLQKLEQAIRVAGVERRAELGEDFVGDLYATDGFPIDLTRLIAEEAGLAVDEEAAHAWVVRTHGAAETRVGDEAVAAVYKELALRHGPTEFVGYDREQAESTVLALLRGGARVESAEAGAEELELVTAATPCYGRAGGQLGDTGAAAWAGGRFEIADTQKPGGQLHVHVGKLRAGRLAVGDHVVLRVDGERRQRIRLNHSATHLLHHALRATLGSHVAQKGSEVAPDYLRFDFSHFEALTPAQLARIETLVNDELRRDAPSRTEVKPYEEAQRSGAMALFGEKYGDTVRVVQIGRESRELCGGTHVARAGEIGLFKIVSEEALALGVRRVVALTGPAALEHVQRLEGTLRALAAKLKTGWSELEERVEKLLAQAKESERREAELRRKLATGGGEDLLARAREVRGVRVLATRVEAADPKTLREAGDTLRDRLGSGLLVLGGEHEGKATLLVMVTKDLVGRYHAGKIAARLVERLEGRGGGRPDMAQAGGPRVDKLDEALALAYELV
jgi:alanyl-tRNA synthetase